MKHGEIDVYDNYFWKREASFKYVSFMIVCILL